MSSDVEAREYDLGTTSVRLIRAGNVVQMFFSNKLDAKFYFDSAAEGLKELKTM